MVAAFFQLADLAPLAGAGIDAGKRRQFEEEALPLFDSLYSGAVALTHNREEAEDLLQETFLKAWRGFGQFKPGTNLRAWLYRIMFNAYISRYRRKKRSPVSGSFDESSEVPGGTTTDDVVNERNAWLKLGDKMALEDFKQQLDSRLKTAVEALPDEFRDVLVLNVVNDLPYKEISEILDIPVGTVMSRLSRAKSMIRDRLGQNGANGLNG